MENLSIIDQSRTVDKFVEEYVKVLNEKTDSYNFYTRRGQRYIKITEVVVDRDGKNTNQVSVHCFVDKKHRSCLQSRRVERPRKRSKI